jgi:hypothetical protein
VPTRKNTSRAPSPQPHPLYIWPRPGDDLPRLPWSAYLRLIALQIDTDYPGAVGRFLSAHIIALSLQAEALGATSPDAHERLAQAEADREAAWHQALLDEAAQPGIWSLTDPDDVGGWGGHLCEDAASQYWIANDPGDETWSN